MSGSETITVLHYVGYDHDSGGILAVLHALAAEARFHCVLGVNPGFRSSRTASLETLAFSATAGDTIGAANLLRTWLVARQVRNWLRADRRRIFHGHSRAGLLAALWLNAWGERRVVATVHCYGRQRWFYRWAAGRLRKRIQWLSPAMKRYYGIGDDTWKGCLPGCFQPGDWRGVVRRARDGTVRFGCVGALVPVKEWELVIRALAEIPRAIPLRVLHAGGEGGVASGVRYAARLRELTVRLGVAERVEWRGAVRDMATFYADVDCLLIASRFEAFSIAALEAGACGVPVLAANAPGNRDLVSAAKLGWLFSAGSAHALAQEMIRLATSDALREWALQPALLERFTAESSAEEHIGIYRELLAS